jgi:hypothetical protein
MRMWAVLRWFSKETSGFSCKNTKKTSVPIKVVEFLVHVKAYYSLNWKYTSKNYFVKYYAGNTNSLLQDIAK